MDDVICLVPEKTSLRKGKPPGEKLGLCPHSEQRPGKDEQTCGGRSFQTHGEISSARGGGTPDWHPWGWGWEKAPGRITRSSESGSRQLSSPEPQCGGGVDRLSLVLCRSKSRFWGRLVLLAVQGLWYCLDIWFHTSAHRPPGCKCTGICLPVA